MRAGGLRVISLATLWLFAAAMPVSAAALTTIWTFQGGAGGAFPANGSGPIAVGAQGQLYFGTSAGVVALTPPVGSNKPWTEKMVFAFPANEHPYSVIIGRDTGVLYGTSRSNGCGEVFRLVEPATKRPPWHMDILYAFPGDLTRPSLKEGCGPFGGVTIGRDGLLYGTTLIGGGSFVCGSVDGVPTGCGTIFALTSAPKPPWTIVTLPYDGQNGADPLDAPVEDPQANGVFYASTNLGGAPKGDQTSGAPGVENEFERVSDRIRFVPPAVIAWYLAFPSVAYPQASPTPVPRAKPLAFSAATAAAAPVSVLVGTSTGGGVQSDICQVFANNGCGTVYRLTRPASGSGPWALTVLHAFEGGSDGANPTARLTVLANGDIYGTTTGGEVAGDRGTIFRLVPDAASKTGYSYAVVHRFTGKDGSTPSSQLTPVGTALYGLTSAGGSAACPGGCGTVFKLAP